MALDHVGRQYADKLFHQLEEDILKAHREELVKVRQDFAARNMTTSGIYFTAQVKVYVRQAELLADTRVNSLLDAYEKSGTPLDDTAFAEITAEAARFCDQQGRNIVQVLTNAIGQTYGKGAPEGLSKAISNQVLGQISGISARITRRLSIMRDETVLSTRKSAAGQSSNQTKSAQSTAPGDQVPVGDAARQNKLPHPHPHLYYWRFFSEFGRECYRTWRWELFASFGVSFITYLITKGDDPLAWRNFQIAFVATALTLAVFAVWHLIRTPWIVHRSLQSAGESPPHWALGIVGIAVLGALVVGGFLSVTHLHEISPPLVKFSAPPPPITPSDGEPQEKPAPDRNKQNLKPVPRPGSPKPIAPNNTGQTAGQTVPPTAQPSPPATFLDRVIQENRGLTPDDRNRLSNELYECDQFIKQSQAVGYKLNLEFGKLTNDRQSGALSKNVDEHIKILGDLGTAAMDRYHGLQHFQEKWQYFPDQTEYVFGDNPFNAGVGLLANAAGGMTTSLTRWSKIDNRDQQDILNIEAQQQVDAEKYLRQFFDWANLTLQRVKQMRQSLDPNGVVQPIPTNAVAPAIGMFSSVTFSQSWQATLRPRELWAKVIITFDRFCPNVGRDDDHFTGPTRLLSL